MFTPVEVCGISIRESLIRWQDVFILRILKEQLGNCFLNYTQKPFLDCGVLRENQQQLHYYQTSL